MQELKIVIEVFHMVFGAIYQDHFLKFNNFYFSLHSNTEMIDIKIWFSDEKSVISVQKEIFQKICKPVLYMWYA